jgi:hypothetical protein
MSGEEQSIELLVVADTWCDAQSTCDEVWQTIGDRRGRIFVVSPALAGRVHTWVSDIDKELAGAEERLNDVLIELRDRGYVASGKVGDPDPILAIRDAVTCFRANEILLVTSPATDENWRERQLLERTAAFGLPVSCVRVAEVALT